jgi:hypothetical protein
VKNLRKGVRKKFTWKTWLSLGVGFVICGLIAAVLFIKLDTAAAANFTDQFLRPMIGDNQVVSLESAFFNISDAVNQIEYIFIKPTNLFISGGSVAIIATGTAAQTSTLDLAPLSIPGGIASVGEGVWRDLPLSLFPGRVVLADTFVNPDPARPYAFVTLVKMDMSRLRLWSVAGTQEPGGKVGKPGTGVVPQSIQTQGTLVAAFDGGFQYRDGQYGMIVGSTTYLPLKNNLATLVGYSNGSLAIVKYEGQNLGSNVSFVRQNCPMLIENGVIETQNDANRTLWGRTITSSIYTWRSGIGITAKGNLIFAIGNSLVPSTLAAALASAGAVNAMQLDINPYWVRFNIFNNYSNGTYSHSTIMKGVVDGSYNYLNGYQKDFFYVTKK